jgi:adenylate kinase
VKRLIFLGPPGAGKGTQSQIVAQELGLAHISTGDILRAAVANQTALGQQAKDFMDRGELVPDELVLGLVRERLGEADAQVGWILDGFPRNTHQAEALDRLLASIGQTPDCAINLDVRDEVLIERMLQRGRKDDAEDVIRRRLEVYREQTEPLIGYFKGLNQLVSVDGDGAVDQVTSRLKDAVSAK